MPEFPELGWNDVPHPVNEQQHNDVPPVQDAVQQEEVEEIQSQESIILQLSEDSVDNVDNAAKVAALPAPSGASATSSSDWASFYCLWTDLAACDAVAAYF